MSNKLSIKVKLTVSFIVVFILFGWGILTATSGVVSTSERFEQFFSTNYVRQTAYQNMFSSGLLSGVALRNLVLKPELKKPYQVVPKAIARFDTAYQAALEASQDIPEAMGQLKEIDTYWQQSRAAKFKVLELMKDGDTATATQVLAKEEHPNWQKVRIAVQKLAQAEEVKAAELRELMLQDESDTIRNTFLITIIALLLGAVIAYLMIRNINQAFTRILDSLNDIASGEGDLTMRLVSDGNDEVARMGVAFNQFVSKIQALIVQIADTSNTLSGSAKELTEMSVQTKYKMNQQESKIHQVATAMNEMTATVQEVARNAADASDAAHAADSEAVNGNLIVDNVTSAINDLALEVQESAGTIATLEENAEQIGTVLDVIRGIAEQTNLLALNAAIEAARAGEQGRGFAVVADEVRTLASRTQDSTREIQSMIERLQEGSKSAVLAMDQSQKKTERVVEQAHKAGEALTSITMAVSRIADMNTQIATAAEQQSAVSEDINENVVGINTLAIDAAGSAEHTTANSQDLERVAADLQDAISTFKV